MIGVVVDLVNEGDRLSVKRVDLGVYGAGFGVF